MPAGMILLNSCSMGRCNTSASAYYEWPKAGKAVAEELQTIPYEGYEHTWEWLSRLRKLQLQIENKVE